MDVLGYMKEHPKPFVIGIGGLLLILVIKSRSGAAAPAASATHVTDVGPNATQLGIANASAGAAIATAGIAGQTNVSIAGLQAGVANNQTSAALTASLSNDMVTAHQSDNAVLMTEIVQQASVLNTQTAAQAQQNIAQANDFSNQNIAATNGLTSTVNTSSMVTGQIIGNAFSTIAMFA